MKPFYSKSRGKLVVDARCTCGHAESKHGSVLRASGDEKIRLPNAGGCCSGHCDCDNFTWAGWITESSNANLVVMQ